MIVFDASVLIAHFNPADAHHHAATAIILDAEVGRLLVHPVTVAEVLVGAVRIGQGQAMVDDLHAAGLATASVDQDEPLRLAEYRVRTGLKLPDCCVLDLAVRERATLATFDDALAAAAVRVGLPVSPARRP